MTVLTSTTTSTTTTESETYTMTDPVSEASSIIVRDGDQGFCTQYLGYPTSPTVVTRTASTTVVISSTKTTPSTETDVEYVTITTTVTSTSSYGVMRRAALPVTSVQASILRTDKRAASIAQPSSAVIPAALTTYPPDVLSSACSLNAVQQIPQTSGEDTTTTTAPPALESDISTTTTTSTETATYISTEVIFPSNVPAVYLAHPTAIAGDTNGSPSDYDDNYYPMNLPFPMQIYGHASSSIFVSTNGVSIPKLPSSFRSSDQGLVDSLVHSNRCLH